jgi:hypothetical protein
MVKTILFFLQIQRRKLVLYGIIFALNYRNFLLNENIKVAMVIISNIIKSQYI